MAYISSSNSFKEFLAHTDEKIQAISKLNPILELLPMARECIALDVACGEGTLSSLIIRSLQRKCHKLNYASLDKDQNLAQEALQKLSNLGLGSYGVIVGDAFAGGTLLMPANPMLIVNSHMMYYSGDIAQYIKTMKEKLSPNGMLVFIHQEGGSINSCYRQKYSIHLQSDVTKQITEALSRLGFANIETSYSAKVNFPLASTAVLLKSSSITKLAEFLVQEDIATLEKHGVLESYISDLAQTLEQFHNHVPIWMRIQIAVLPTSNLAPFLSKTGIELANQPMENNWIELHNAALQNNLVIAERLILQGANVNYIGKGGVTPIVIAIVERQFKMVELLKNKGGSLEGHCGQTNESSPFHIFTPSDLLYYFRNEIYINISKNHILCIIFNGSQPIQQGGKQDDNFSIAWLGVWKGSLNCSVYGRIFDEKGTPLNDEFQVVSYSGLANTNVAYKIVSILNATIQKLSDIILSPSSIFIAQALDNFLKVNVSQEEIDNFNKNISQLIEQIANEYIEELTLSAEKAIAEYVIEMERIMKLSSCNSYKIIPLSTNCEILFENDAFTHPKTFIMVGGISERDYLFYVSD